MIFTDLTLTIRGSYHLPPDNTTASFDVRISYALCFFPVFDEFLRMSIVMSLKRLLVLPNWPESYLIATVLIMIEEP